MTFNFEIPKAQLVEHYADLAMTPGWEQYTDARLWKLAQEIPELFGDMPELVKKVVDERGARA